MHKDKRRRDYNTHEFYIKELDAWLTLEEMTQHSDNKHKLKRVTIENRVKRLFKGGESGYFNTVYKCLTLGKKQGGRCVGERKNYASKRRPVPPDAMDDCLNLMHELIRGKHEKRMG